MNKINTNIKKLLIILGIGTIIGIMVAIIGVLLPIQNTRTNINDLVIEEEKDLFNNELQMIEKSDDNQKVNTLLQPIIDKWKMSKINKLQELDSDFNTRLLEATLDTKYLLKVDFKINEVQTKKFHINNSLNGNKDLLVSNEAIFKKQIIVDNDVTINLDQTNKLVVEGSTEFNLLNSKMINKFSGDLQVGLENSPNNLLLKTTNTITKDLIVKRSASFQENLMVGSQIEEKSLIAHAKVNFRKNVDLKNTQIHGDVDFGNARITNIPPRNQINNLSPITKYWTNINKDGTYGGNITLGEGLGHKDGDNFFYKKGTLFLTLEWGSHGSQTFFIDMDWEKSGSPWGKTLLIYPLFYFYQYDKRVIENKTYEGIWRHTISVRTEAKVYDDSAIFSFFGVYRPILKETTLVFLSSEDDTLYNTDEIKKDLLQTYTKNDNKLTISIYNLLGA